MTPTPNHGNLDAGLGLFNRGLFFEAHEVLEDVWRGVPGDQPLRRHLQGLVQLAVAFHHHSSGNCVGARSVLARAIRNLHGGEKFFPEFDLERLLTDLDAWLLFLDSQNELGAGRQAIHRRAVPELPKILLRR